MDFRHNWSYEQHEDNEGHWNDPLVIYVVYCCEEDVECVCHPVLHFPSVYGRLHESISEGAERMCVCSFDHHLSG